jgi:outer membrane biosynthesis protein TonB
MATGNFARAALPPPPPGAAPPRPREAQAPHALSPRAMLQIAVIWHGTIIGYRLQRRRRKITVGPHKRASFITPSIRGVTRFALLTPRKNGYVLHLAPELRGELNVGGQTMSVADVSSSAVDLVRGDRAKLTFNDGSDLRIEIRWVDPPEVLTRPRVNDPEMVRTMVGTSVVLGLLALFLTFVWEKETPKPPLALNPDRITKIEAPQAIEFQKQQVKKQEEKEKAEQSSKQKEGQTTRAKEKAGKLGRADAKEKDTIIPKGREDILREKVQNTGLLSIFGKQKAPGSGISKLFSQSNDVEQAMAGMAGAKLVAGRGAGGLTTSGTGTGGGGTGFGHIYGAGNLDTGGRGAKGKGRGPKLAERGEHEVSVGLGSGGGDADGSLSKEQINKVVKAHLAGVKYCYEKELQHKTSLSGGVDIFWVIQPDGSVSKASVKSSTMNDTAVEGCIVRQVKQWQFPKAPAQTTVTRYPFIFKGG